MKRGYVDDYHAFPFFLFVVFYGSLFPVVEGSCFIPGSYCLVFGGCGCMFGVVVDGTVVIDGSRLMLILLCGGNGWMDKWIRG